MARHSLRMSDDLAAMIRGLHPDLKKQLKAALLMLMDSPHCGKMLRDELDGLRSLRIKKIRIIYRLASKGIIELIACGPRRTIYEETYRLIRLQKSLSGYPKG